jgi:membrane-bound lytic murein transglycosylase B
LNPVADKHLEIVTMPPAQPRRPRPGPHPAARRVASPVEAAPPTESAGSASRAGVIMVDGEAIRVPGPAAFLKRHPALGQRAAVAAIATGVALFVVASVTTSLAGADVAKAAGPTSSSSAAPAPLPAQLSIDPAAPAVQKVLKRTPTHVKTPAPVTHGVISGLAANGIPRVALNAYRVAAARMGNVEPGCGIDWALLAGIGREESDHGRFAGAVLHSDGVSTPAIIGPALDGVHWDYIPAPGNGLALDGDAKFAHALGPMQFIPSTWAIYGTDANGDGKADIFNINDAALGAARYLCAAGGNLGTHGGQVRAVLAYNHSDQYLAQVLALADAYRRGVSISGIPVGITTGALPKVTDTGYIPPANPGAPTAVDRSKTTTKAPPKSTKSTPAPGKSGSTTARQSSTAGSVASGTKTSPAPSGTKTTPKPSPTTSTSTPAPTPTKTCNPLEVLLGCKPS